MTTNTKIDLDAIEARVKAATPGPWVDGHGWYNGPLFDVVSASGRTICGCSTCDRGDGVGEDENNAAFIMHARTDIPAFIAEVRRLRETVARLREEVALLNAHINKRNADDFHALAEHQHEVNTLRARIEAGIAAAHEGREEIIAAVNSIPFGERLDKIVAALHEGEDRR